MDQAEAADPYSAGSCRKGEAAISAAAAVRRSVAVTAVRELEDDRLQAGAGTAVPATACKKPVRAGNRIRDTRGGRNDGRRNRRSEDQGQRRRRAAGSSRTVGHVVTVTDAEGTVRARLLVTDGRVARELYEHPFAITAVPNLFEPVAEAA